MFREAFMLWECKTKKIPGGYSRKGKHVDHRLVGRYRCASNHISCDNSHSIAPYGAEFQGIIFQMSIKEIL